MGRVYAAEHTGIGKKVALKILHAVFANTAEAVERFRAEARMTSQIANAHIVDVTDSGTTADGRLYFVMERLDGVELGEAMREGNLSLERALRITRQIAEALAAAHAQGVIHRDLKPENVLLIERDGDRDFVKVLDFGIALTVGGGGEPRRRLTQPGLAVGTPEYMAPEQAMEATADERSDIYALGAILYEMATGQQAYRGDTFTKILLEKVQHDPPPPRELRGDLAPDVEAVIVKAMARKPADRHQAMTELIAELTACLEALSRPASAPTPAPPPPTATPTATARAPVTASSLLLEPVDPTAATVAMTIEKPAPRKRDVIPLVLVLALVLGGAVALYLLVLRPSGDATKEPSPAPAVASAAPEKKPRKPIPTTSPAKTSAKAPAKAEVAAPARPPADDEPAPKAAPAPKTLKQARALLARAKTAAKKKQWDSARELYDRVARGRFATAQGHLGLAQVELATGDAKDAARHAKTSVRLGGGTPAKRVLAQANAKLKKSTRKSR